MDLMTGIFRNFGRRIPSFGIVKASEHINYFSNRTLRCLAGECGLAVVESAEEPDHRLNGLRLGRLGAVCVKV